MADTEMRKYYLFAVKAFSDILGTILVPAVLALVLKYLLDPSPLVFLLLLGVTFVLTAILLVRKIKNYGRSFQQLNGEDELRSSRGGTVVPPR